MSATRINNLDFQRGYINNAVKNSSISCLENTLKTSYKDVSEYSQYLSEKYDFFNKQTTIQGVPVTVSVSSAFLKKCFNDSEKAEYLESNLDVIEDCVKKSIAYTSTMLGSPVMTYCSFTIESDGNITMISGCTNDPDGKIARENAAKRAKENKEKEEKLQKKASERAERYEELLEELRKRNKGEYRLIIKGENIQNIISRLNEADSSIYTLMGMDIKV